MLLRPTTEDVRVIVRTIGLSLYGLGLATATLGTVALVAGDPHSATALLAGAAIASAIGGAIRVRVWTRGPLSWTRAVVAATLSWVAASLVGAVPMYLSGHWRSYLDAVFDAMSGLTTTGLTLVQDLDHLPLAMGLYRHLLELVGGLAFVVVGLTVLTAATATASSLTPSDVRDERILPNPARTWHQVWGVGSAILAAGLVVCTVAVVVAGVPVRQALAHGLSLTVSAATTGRSARRWRTACR